jgi:hypothetical protein
LEEAAVDLSWLDSPRMSVVCESVVADVVADAVVTDVISLHH